ncbi:hypothetical protein, partial [Bradyrhizobium zhanjiangense]|uniref:hypothetical protein n=1 Tax=Bradyrhizobium zhanjiangense TaxID=1325107 RepID=UPI0019D71307
SSMPTPSCNAERRGLKNSSAFNGCYDTCKSEAVASYSVIARSPRDEAIQNLSAERLWIASLRSQ